jgi:hypothetical protein
MVPAPEAGREKEVNRSRNGPQSDSERIEEFIVVLCLFHKVKTYPLKC